MLFHRNTEYFMYLHMFLGFLLTQRQPIPVA